MTEFRALVTCPHLGEAIELYRDVLSEHGVAAKVAVIAGQHLSEDDLLAIVEPFHAIVAGDDDITDRVMAAAPRLKVIAKWGVGVDGIDLAAARRRGIEVRNTPDMFGNEVADYALGMILLLARRLHEVDRAVREGDWLKPRGVSLQGKTLGVVGLGSSGRELCRRGHALRMNVIGYDIAHQADPECQIVGFEELLRTADVVSLHLSLNPSSRGLIDAERLALMKPSAWLVNTSRGAIVDQEALVAAVTNETLAGAALDVFHDEPLPANHALTRIDRVVLGSHNASNTAEAVQRTNERAIANLLEGLGLR